MKGFAHLIGIGLFGLSIYFYDRTNKRLVLEVDWKGKTIYGE